MSAAQEPIGVGEHQKLTDMLAGTIGADVENAMNAVGWEHTTNPPQVPAVANPPADSSTPTAVTAPATANPSANASPAATSTDIDWESFRDPVSKKILGKYDLPVDAARGMHSLIHLAKDALAQRDEALRRAAEIEHERLNRSTQPSPAPVVETTLTADPDLSAVLARIKENNGILEEEDAVALVNVSAKAAAQSALQAQQEREAQARAAKEAHEKAWSAVDEYMTANHPNSMKYVDEMSLYVQTHPEVKEVVESLLSQGRLKEATVYSWREFERTIPVATPEELRAEEAARIAAAVREKEEAENRLHAGQLPSSPSGVHETPPNQQGYTPEQRDLAGRIMRQTGDGRMFREMVFGQQLTGPWFEPQG